MSILSFRYLGFALFGLFLVSNSYADSVKHKEPAELGDTKFELALREQRMRGAADSPELRNAVRQNLVALAAMAREARKVGLHKQAIVKAQLELAEQNLLAQAWQQKALLDRPPREDELRVEYDRLLAGLGSTDYRLRHILVEQEGTAKNLIEQLKGGAKFADLAQANSLDAQTRVRGGETDWVNVSALAAPLADALKSLTNGQFASAPVKTETGWHVLQREDSRPFEAMTYEQAKPQIQAIVGQRLLAERIKELTETTKEKK